MAVAERFWARVEKTASCWLWRGAIGGEGYGQLQISLRYWKAHRAAWLLTNGVIPAGLDVLHHCDNPPCVRPDHLFLGTRGDNNRDRAAKGRSAKGDRHGTHTHPFSYRGERHGRAKLTAEQVHAIRREWAAGIPKLRLAQQYGMSRRAIRAILAGTTWGWLPSQ